MTIIFGNNASGKSGYGRLLREAVTARVKGDLLGDVFNEALPEQNAALSYFVDEDEHTWSLQGAQHASLSAVRFYDTDCGDSYISKAEEITYRPYALTLLDRLQSLCRAVRDVLDQKLESNGHAYPDLPELSEETESHKFLNSLSEATSEVEINAATQLADDHTEALAADKREIARLVASDPNTEKLRLSNLATYWHEIAQFLTTLSEKVDVDAFSDLTTAKLEATNLRKAADAASVEQFKDETLEGIGSESWRALWEAAKLYSTEEAYHERPYPHTGVGTVCVLCQQPLTESAADRLNRFERYVADTTSRKALLAERQLGELRSIYEDLSAMPAPVTEAIAKLSAEAEDMATVVEWIEENTRAAANVAAWIDGTVEELPSPASISPKPHANGRMVALKEKAASINTETYNSTLSSLRNRVREIEAKGQLKAAVQSLKQTVVLHKERAKLERAKQQTNTSGITQKATALTTEYATAVARDQFTRETERLGLQRITLSPMRGRGTVTLEHRPALIGAHNAVAVSEVFSEGEQTALGLAGFLTEVELDDSKSAVILDDPVTSLDAGRRSHVAKRLIELASERQVIVFTHEITFVNALLNQAKDQGETITPRAVQRQGSNPGKVIEEFPWQAKDVPQRIDQLSREIARFKRGREDMDDQQYMKEVRSWAGDLSEAWERAVNLEVIDQVVDRGTSQVKPLKLKILPRFTQEDHDVFQNGYGQVSSWAGRHDNAPEENFHAPEIHELESELERLRVWYGRVKGYKN